MSQARIIDAREILPQNGVGGLISPGNGRAKLRAHLAEETEAPLLVAMVPEPVDFRSDGKDGEFIGMVQRYRKAQDCQVPCPDQPRM